MIKHLFKLVWNRKRSNVLLVGEVFCSFLVVFAVITFGMYYADNYRRPLGFSYENVWSIFCLPDIEMLGFGSETELGAYYQQVYRALQEFEEVEAVAGAEAAIPYSMTSTSVSSYSYKGRSTQADNGKVSDRFHEVLGMELVQGRWFDGTDVAQNVESAVVTETFARELFGDEDPIGKEILQGKEHRLRIIGVVDDFRRFGEFSPPNSFLFNRFELDDVEQLNKNFPSHFLLKVHPGTPLEFKEKLAARIQAITRDLRIEIRAMEEMRGAFFKWRLMPLWIGGIIAALLMGMVGLSLMGVLWQNVTQRTAEIGLRRALGGVAGDVYTQFIGELLIVSTIGVALGVALVVQFPLLDLVSSVSNQVYAASLAVSSLVIYLLVVACGLYPSRMATRIPPADALHYE